ncbi:MAG: ribonuclease III [Planctomycetota bacterium]|jgi:ribonuclease-3
MLQCQERIGYLFRREGLLRKALTHSSVKDDKNPSNERLEFLGDAILGMVISEYLFSLLPGNDEGDLTKVKSVVVSSHTLARLGEELEIDKFLLIGKGIRLRKEIPRSLIANAVEAIIAAVYLDRGMEAARHFVLDHLHSYVQEVLQDDHREKNFKSILQQQAQKEFAATPVYHVRSASGPDHSKSFHIAASIGDREFPVGRGHSKKEAEQEAARSALRALKERHPRGSKKSKKKAQRSKKAAQKKRQAKDANQTRSAPKKARSAPKKARSAPKKAQRKSKKAQKAAKAEPKSERKTRRRRSRAPSSNGR